MNIKLIFLVFIFLVLNACNRNSEIMKYKVTKVSKIPEINANWDKAPWQDIDALYLTAFMGEKPVHFPQTQAKIAYDDSAIYVIFRVEDQYVKAVHAKNQDPVYKDSCVEFFFTPEEDSNEGYFNLEMNCGGTMLFHYQKKPGIRSKRISDAHIDRIKVAHSLPKIVNPEMESRTTWVVEYRIPFSILTDYHQFSLPKQGAKWRANLYKCADDTSHPHWITWAPVDHPEPNFHLPKYFGWLDFD